MAAAYQMLRDEGMAESRQGGRIVPHHTTPAAVHRANGFFASLLSEAAVDADLSLAAVDYAPQVAAALTDPETTPGPGRTRRPDRDLGYFPHGLLDLRTAANSHLTEHPDPARHLAPGDLHHQRQRAWTC